RGPARQPGRADPELQSAVRPPGKSLPNRCPRPGSNRGDAMNQRFQAALLLAALGSVIAPPAFALKYAEPEHNLKVDPAIPNWQPGEVKSEPEEELNIVRADIMDEI